ncbi:MAG: hypothetical protein H9789_04385 [Candidatus Paraprevotella stercoravium]|jgi:hypothetical protein|uniref:Uncharacterized protein n=2 Tax=Bacteroidales TaxID=171549 RepID=A0ABT7U320_9BACE|nr:hypothetical protein [Candidatus Paraprevotella stercoravium]MDM8144916.1 hypothetical protein [Bacteroides eggerthii]
MNKQDINKNLAYSGVLCILCLALGALCLWLRLLELAAALACLALFEGLIFGIWYQRLKKAKRKEEKSPFKYHKP